MTNKIPIVFYRTIFELLPDPAFILNKNLEIKLCNIEIQNLLGKSNDYLISKKIDKVFEGRALYNNISEISKKEGIFTIKDKLIINKKNYEIRCVISEELGDNFLIILKLLEDQNNKLFSSNLDFFNEIFSILSHEVNNPISSIKLASDLIERRYINVDKELLEIIKSEANRISRLFSNFNLSNLNQISNRTPENIHELIRLSLFKIKQMPNRIKIIEEFDPSLPEIRINRDFIIQCLDNIFINGYESSLDNLDSFIKVKTSFVLGESVKIPNIKNYIKKNFISIIISENGKGINENEIKKVFLPFFSTKKRGSGVGLFLVKKIIDDHDGEITIESKDGITSVKIILPF